MFNFILAHNNPSATAADDSPELLLMKLNLLQTRKRCKRPSAKRAPGRHPGLFQISWLFRTRFSADFSPGQEEQPMFWLKDSICGIVQQIFLSVPISCCECQQILSNNFGKALNQRVINSLCCLKLFLVFVTVQKYLAKWSWNCNKRLLAIKSRLSR